MDDKKQCVSVRLKPKDLEKIESIAERLKVRNSDVIRYAIKTTLTRLMDLQDPAVGGHRLLPLFIDHCNEFNRHFDLDADRLDEIINAPVEDEQLVVDRSDIELLALCGLPHHYIQNKLKEITGGTAHSEEDIPQLLNHYLIEKYRDRASNDESTPPLQ